MINNTKKAFSEWHEIRAERLVVFYEELRQLIEPLVIDGYSLEKLAIFLNSNRYKTFWGKQWTPVLVGRALKKMGLRTIFQRPLEKSGDVDG